MPRPKLSGVAGPHHQEAPLSVGWAPWQGERGGGARLDPEPASPPTQPGRRHPARRAPSHHWQVLE